MKKSINLDSLFVVIGRSALGGVLEDVPTLGACLVTSVRANGSTFKLKAFTKLNSDSLHLSVVNNATKELVFSGDSTEPIRSNCVGDLWVEALSQQLTQLELNIANYVSLPSHLQGVRAKDTHVAKRVLRNSAIKAELDEIIEGFTSKVQSMKPSLAPAAEAHQPNALTLKKGAGNTTALTAIKKSIADYACAKDKENLAYHEIFDSADNVESAIAAIYSSATKDEISALAAYDIAVANRYRAHAELSQASSNVELARAALDKALAELRSVPVDVKGAE